MRRSLASLLLVVLIGSFALPFLQATSHVPACCLRRGQHHCTTPLPGDGFHSAAPNCPYRHSAALISHAVTALRTSSHSLFLDRSWNNSLYRGSFLVLSGLVGGTSERGPPLA